LEEQGADFPHTRQHVPKFVFDLGRKWQRADIGEMGELIEVVRDTRLRDRAAYGAERGRHTALDMVGRFVAVIARSCFACASWPCESGTTTWKWW
jgi:hypothetical protein